VTVLGHHPHRLEIARGFGATDVVEERGDQAVERVRELTGGAGST
jgi:alcohol dehydrogenase